MKYEKTFIVIGLVALILAVPVAYAMKSRTNQLKIERTNSTRLELRIDSVQRQLEKKEQQIKQQEQENGSLKQQLQSKREQAAKVAAAASRPAQTGSTAPSVAFKPAAALAPASCASLRPVVAQYAWPVDTAMAVMQAESGCRPGAENPTDYHVICSGSRGLFQIGCDSTTNYAGMFDANANIAHAYSMYARRGWQPWGAYTSGAYLKYLP